LYDSGDDGVGVKLSMNLIFEFLFKYRPLLYEKGTLSFHSLWSPYVTWFLVAVALVGTWWLYRRTSAVLPNRWRYALCGVRAASFLVLILIFSQPVLRLHSAIPQKNFIAIAYDISRSMEIRDGRNGQTRLNLEQQLLRPAGNPLLDELAARFRLRFFRFSGSAERAEAFADLPRHGEVTDLDKSLTQIASELDSVPVAGIVLLSDGADNKSANLARTAAQLRARNIPVYPIGIGSPGFGRDAEVLRVTAPKKVLKGTMVETEVSVRATGLAGRRAKLLVSDGERLLQSQEIEMGSDGEVKSCKISFSSHATGARIIRFRLEPFAEEVVPENNDQTVLLEVSDEQPQVLYVEGAPRLEYAFIRRAVADDTNLRLVTLLRQADGKFLRQGVDAPSTMEKGFPVEKAELFRYKAIILGSVEANFFTFDQLRMISDFVSQRGGGFLMLGGGKSFGQGGYVNTPLEDLLPINLDRGVSDVPEFLDQEFRIRPTGYGLLHPIMRLSPLEEQNRKRWDEVPALVGFNPTSGAKPGATVLAQGSVPDSRGRSPVILAVQRFGQGKSAALATAATWRWKMGMEHTDTIHSIFWKQMLRWLASDVPDPVDGAVEKHSYSLDESAVFQTEVRDSSFMPLNNARVVAMVKAPSGQMHASQLDWNVEKNGIYSTTFKPQEEGIYEVTAEAFQGNKSLGVMKTNFRVAPSNEEFHNAALNAGLLKRLSDETGGRYYSPGDVRTLPEDISYIDKGSSRIEEKDLWDMPFLFMLLTGLVSTEWILRKRKGLL
jgi:uncharacterized membrane protein